MLPNLGETKREHFILIYEYILIVRIIHLFNIKRLVLTFQKIQFTQKCVLQNYSQTNRQKLNPTHDCDEHYGYVGKKK